MILSTIPVEVPPESPDCVRINQLADEYSELLHAAAGKLNQIHEVYWRGTLGEVVARLNALGLAQVTAAGEAHQAQAIGLNELLTASLVDKAALGERLAGRAIATPKFQIAMSPEAVESSDIEWDGEQFSEILPSV